MSLFQKYSSFQRLSINLTFAACSLLIGSSAYAEDAPDISWTKLLGTSDQERSEGVSTASDGSIYTSGYVYDGDLDGETNAGGYDAFLIKYSSSGTKAWTKLFGTSSSDVSYGVSTASDGSIYVTGKTEGALDGQTNAGGYDGFLTKYSSSGTKVWTKLLGTSSNDYGYEVSTASDGSIYISGVTYGALDGETHTGNEDIFLTKYSSDGTKAWTKLLGTSANDHSYGVSTASDGSIYITGYTRGDLDGETNSGGFSDAYLTKYASDGTKLWTKLLGSSSSDYGRGVSTASDGSIFITGATKSDLDGETHSGGVFDAFLTKYSSDGTKLWTKLLGSSSNDYSYSVSTASDGSVYITGYTSSDLDGESSSGENDIFVTKYSSDGTKLWTKLLGTSEDDVGNGVSIASDGTIYITGYTAGALNGETNAGGGDVFLIRLASTFSTSINSAQPYAAMQSVGLNAVKHQRDLVLNNAGECNKKGWTIENSKYCVFATANKSLADIEGNDTYAGYDTANFNSIYGIEKAIDNIWTIGASYGHGTTDLSDYSFGDTTANFDSNLKGYSAYAVKRPNENLKLSGVINYATFDLDGTRRYGATNGYSDYDANAYSAELNAAWDVPIQSDFLERTLVSTPLRLQPMIGLAWAKYNQDSITETGNGSLLTINQNTSKSLLMKTGIELESQIPVFKNKSLLVPRVGVGYELDWWADSTDTTSVDAKLTSSSLDTTEVKARNQGAHNGVINIGADLFLTQKFALNANAAYKVSSSGMEKTFGGGFRWLF